MPGTICLHPAQYLSTYGGSSVSAPSYLQVELAQNTIDGITYQPVTSRGSGVQFIGQSGATIGSTATAHTIPDALIVNRGAAHHLHPTMVDSIVGASFLGSWTSAGGILFGVETPCPYMTCGPTDIYFHVHDSAHNFIKPASPDGFRVDPSQTGPEYSEHGKSPTAGALGSVALRVFGGTASTRTVTAERSSLSMGVENTEVPSYLFVPPFGPASRRFGGSVAIGIAPGAPHHLGLTVESPLGSNTDNPFGLTLSLYDQYNNLQYGSQFCVSGSSNYVACRTINAWWTAQPSNAPNGDVPLLMGQSGTHDSLATAVATPMESKISGVIQSGSFLSRFAFSDTLATEKTLLVNAGVQSVLNIQVQETAASSWCAVAGHCASGTGPQTFSMTYTFLPPPGPTTSLRIQNLATNSGVPYTSTNYGGGAVAGLFNTNPGAFLIYPMAPDLDRKITAYACELDSRQNVTKCQDPTDFSFTSTSTADVLVATGSMTGASSLEFFPNLSGVATITASRQINGSTMTANSDPINVAVGLLSDFTLVDDSPTVSPSVAAGSVQTLTLCKKDNADHVIAVPASSTMTINVNNIGAGANSEGSSILLSTATGAGFDAATFTPGPKSLTFVNGCVTLYAKILIAGTFNDGPILGLTYTDPTQSNRLIQGAGLTVGTVTPSAIDHYVTIPDSLTAQAWNVVGSSNTAAPAGNRFGVTVYARDLYGNTVVAPASTTVTLSLATNSGGTAAAGLDLTCAAPANGAACLTIDMSSLSSVVVANLASQIGGTFYIAASDGTSTVSVPKSTSISLVTSQLTVASYGISPSSATAGDLRSLSIAAKDASGATVTGADALLNSLTYSLVDGSGAVLSAHVAPDGSLPVISGPSSFSQGTADFSITYTKAETGLVLNVKDNQSTIIQSANATPITVTAGTLLKYAVTCTMVTGGADCTGTSGSPYSLNASQTAKYNLTINAYDIYKNPKAGEFSVPVRITRTGGSAVSYWDPSNTTYKGLLEQYPQVDPRNVSSNYLVNTSPAAGVTLGNIFYRSGNVDLTIDIDPTLSTMTSMHNSTYHRYLPHIDMVTDYYLRNLDSTPVAGVADIFTLKAVDRAGNLAKGVETDLNGLTFTWTGPLSSPRADVPVLPSSALTFTNGETGDLSVTHYKSGSIYFRFKDNFVPSVSISGGSSTYRDGYEYVSVSTAPGHHYSVNVATGFTTTPLAGQSQDVKVTAQDIYNNPITTWPSDTLSFAWTAGGSPSVTNPKTAGVSTATFLASGSRSFTSGVYQTTGTPFTLYRSHLTALTPKEVSTLTVTGTITAGTVSSTALTGALSFTTSPATSSGYVRIGTSSTYSVGTDISGAAVTATTDQTKIYYGHLFDMYGNSKGNLNPVDWSGTDVLAGKFNGASGTNTLMSPRQIGTGVITASCTSVDAGCLPDSSGTVTITGGLLSDFTLVDDSPAANPSVAAGSEQTLTLCKKDNADHVIAVPASWTTTININNIGAGTNSEGNSILLSTATGAGFDAATFNPGAKSLTFVNGCVTLYAKILVAGTFNDSPILGLTYTDPTQSNRYIQGSGLTVGTVTPLAIAYYVTIPGSDSAQAWSVVGSINTAAPAGNRFGVTVYARDLYGNTVVAPASTTVTLSLATNSGGTAAAAGLDLTCAAPANGAACLTIDMSSLSSVVVANLASQIGGTFYIAASDGTSTVSVPKSTSISLVTSQLTVASYGISPSSATAGDLRSLSIAAKDASGATVTGADALLNSLTYSLVDGSGAVLSAHVAPDGSLPVISGPSSFSQGTADFSITYTKAETGLVLNVKDNQSTIIQSANATPITVTAGTLLKYAVTCTMVTGGADCTGTSGSPYSLNASQTAKYNLTINAYDIYKNPKAGEFSVPVRITRTGGSAVSYWDPSNTTYKGLLEQYPQVDPRNVSSNYLVNTSPAAGVTLGNIFYRSGNVDLTIDIDPTLSTMTSMHNSTYHRYLPHIDMVTDYYLRNLDSTPVAGVADIFTLKAVDRAGNLAKGVETDLNGLTFTWTGPLSSPRADVPVLPSSALTFTNGETGDLSVTHYKSGSIYFRFKDNFVPSVSISGGSSTYRDGYEYVSVSTAPGHHYSVNVATGFTTTPLAGQSQDVKVTAQDIYNNPITTWPSDTLSFAWTAGGSPSVTNPKTAGVSTATFLASGSRSFTSGVYQTTGTPFTLYRSHLTALTPKEVSTLTVTGTITAGTVSSTALTGALSFTTSPATSSGYVRIGTSSTYSVGTDISGAAVTATTDQTKIYYGHLFDMYGNSKGNLNPVDWSGTGVLAGKFNGASGANTEMSPTQIGTGVITASCTSVDAGCLPDSSGTATITVGGINKIVFIAPGLTADFTQTSVTCQQLTTQLQDRNNNPAPVSGNTTIAFASTTGNGEFYASLAECTTAQTGGDGATVNTGTYNTSTLTGSAASRSATITTGNSSVNVWYANKTTVAANGVTITAINGSWTATLHATITADVTKRFAFTSSALNINAWTSPTNTCGLVTYKFQDKWLNNSTSTASSTVNLSSNSGTGSFYSDSGCSTLITSGIRTVATSSANDTVYYKDTQANNATMSLLATSTLSGNTALQVQTLGATVSPGPFGLTNSPVASGSNVKDTVTVNWTASPGARDYTVSFGISNTCGTELSPTTSTAANITTGRNALTYICVRANGYTGSPGMPQLAAMTNIANTGTPFYLWIDNTIPTATITQPATNGAFIGPVTAATVSASNTTFTGTALDTSGSGVSTVQVKLQRGSDTKYWDGSNWVASSTLLSATNTGTTYSTWNYVITNANMDLGGDAIAYTLTTVVTDMSGNIALTAATKAFTWRNSAATVSNVTSTTVSGSYKASVVIPVTVTFNKIQIVNVTGGTPTLAMGPGTSATYVSGSGSAALIFNYIVVAGQTSADLDYATTGALTLNGGTIKDQAENVSTLTLATPGLPGSLGANSAIVIDTTPATVTGVNSSTPDAVKGIGATVSIQVTFSENVTVVGTPTLALNSGGIASCPAVAAVTVLTCNYTVLTSHTSADLDYSATNSLLLGAATINDAASNVSTLTLPTVGGTGSLGLNKNLVIDGTRATVTGVATSTVAGSYKSGQLIPITVTFLENVTVTGTPTLLLNSSATPVNYFSGSGTTALVFNYTVGANDTQATKLDYSATNSLALNTGTILDVAGNTSTLTLPALNLGGSITGASGTPKLIKIDTTNATAAITAPASGVTYIGPVTAATTSGTANTTFTGTAADAGSGVSSVQVILQRLSDNYYWDGSTWVSGSTLLAATGTTSWTYVITNTNMNLAADNTQYTLTTTVTDVVGNIGSAVATKTFTWRNTAATVSSVSSSSSDVGKYTTGGIIAVTVTFNKNVIVTGTPQIAMATGGVAYCVAAAAATVVTCNYTVGANQNSTDLDYASTGALTGGTIKDEAENVSTLTLATPGAANSLGSNKNFVIDTMAPTVTDVNSSTTDGIIGFNGTVSIQVTFSENVTVTNTPTLALNSGGTASYASGSGTNVLTFANTVGATNASADLNYSATNSLAGTIKDAATNAANLTLPALAGGTSLAGHKALVIDGIAATVTGVTTTLAAGSYKLNQIIPITVTFLENVTVTGTPTLLLNSSATPVNYFSGSGTTALVFNYTVGANDTQATKLDYSATNSLALNTGTILDVAGNTSTLTLPALNLGGSITGASGTPKIIKIDTTAPTVTGVTSSTGNGSYKVGSPAVVVTVTFSEIVNVGGTPQLTLENGGSGAVVNYVSGTGTATLTFNYTIGAGDTSADLDFQSTSALALNGGTILDAALNAATLTLVAPGAAGSIANGKAIIIDTTAPTLVFSSGLPGAESKSTTLNIAILTTDTNTYSYAVTSGACAGATYTSGVAVATNITSSITGLSDGNVTVCAQATDLAGNTQATYTSYTWIKDIVAPALFTITAPTGQGSTTSPTVTWTTPATDVYKIDMTVSKTSGCATNIEESYLSSEIASNAASKAIVATLPNGTHYVCMYVYDVSLNKSAVITGSFEIETDIIHVSWTETTNDIRYGFKNQAAAWAVETVETSANTYNSRTSLAIDNAGLPYISYSVNDGTNTYMQYRKRTATNDWTTTYSQNSAANATMAGIGSFNEMAISAAATVYSSFFGYNGSIGGLSLGTDAASSTPTITDTLATNFMDMALAVGASGSQYQVVSQLVSAKYVLKIINAGTNLSGTVTLPTNCDQAPYVSAFAKTSDTVIGLATVCVMSNDNTCHAYYGEATYTGSGANFTYSAWTDIGTVKAATCVLGDLSESDRPSIVYDRQNSNKVSVAWRDQVNNQIKRWTNESGSNANETVLTGSGTIGQQTIALDALGKSYIVYQDGDSVRFVTNNSRVVGNYTGGWSTPAVIATGTTITGIGSVGITGMKGRGNTTNGQ